MAMVEEKGRAKSTPSERERVLREVNEQSVKFIHLWFTDIEGHLKSFSITPAELEGALDDGMGFDGSSITGFNAIEESDMVAIPDPTTFQLMPNGDVRVARMICDVVTPDGQPYDGDPRNVLRRALDRMRSMGFDTFNVGPELEYFIFKDDQGTVPLDEGGYFAMTTMDAASDLRHDTVKALESMGIPIEYVHHEVGPSQHEIDMRYASALDMADHTITYRLVVKEIAKKAGYHATFMPKPIFGENGSGMHTHQSLFKDGKNIFHDPKGSWQLSKTMLAYIGGLLAHARGMVAVTNPLINSFKRLVPGYEAPTNVAWSERNRSPLARVPDRRGTGTRVELRMPDPSCNPYLALAVMLASGLDGIQQKLDPGPPVNKNIYEMSRRERARHRITDLPADLNEAVNAMEKDALVQSTLGEHIFNHYITAKREEWHQYIASVHPWEHERYLSLY